MSRGPPAANRRSTRRSWSGSYRYYEDRGPPARPFTGGESGGFPRGVPVLPSEPATMTSRAPVDLAARFLDPEASEASLSELARGVVGSEILKIAAEIRALKAQGRTVCNLTVGDFDPSQFPAAKGLVDGTVRALQAGHTNYPPSDGVLDLRLAIMRFYERELGLRYPVDSIAVA